jgi:putative copper resistance protein D
MPNGQNIDALYAAVRAVHMAACLVAMSVFALDRFVVAPAIGEEFPEIARRWRAIAMVLLTIAIPAMLISGAAWFAEVAVGMSGLPIREAMHGDVPGLVWNQTEFGKLWKARTFIALAEILTIMLFVRRAGFAWLGLLVSAAVVASLAWAGHGQTGGPPAVHLSADVLHLIVCGFWPAGLLPFVLLAVPMRRVAEHEPPLLRVAKRFSTLALWSVILLTVSGVVNTWFLVAWPSALLSTRYGLILMVKLALFAVMVLLGAANFVRVRKLSATARTGGWLIRNVLVELMLAAGILAAVGVLGLLPPPAEHLLHHHDAESALSESAGSFMIPPEGAPWRN